MRGQRRAAGRPRWPGWGWVVLAAYVGLLAVATVAALDDEAPPAPPATAPDEDAEAAQRFVVAWRASREGTFAASGTIERTVEATGARLASEAFLAQDPPRRLQREFGGVQGRDGDRVLLCPALPDGETAACQLGAPTGVSYEDSVDAEVTDLAAEVAGPEALYGVTVDARGCFHLRQVRVDPRATFGHAARFCFDPETRAPVEREVRFAGGVVERVEYRAIRAEVSEADFRP